MRGFDLYLIASAVLTFYVFLEGENSNIESKK